MTFNLGDWVQWTTTSNGSTKTKVGIIADRLPSRNQAPGRTAPWKWRPKKPVHRSLTERYLDRIGAHLSNDEGLPVDNVTPAFGSHSLRDRPSFVVAVPYGVMGTLWRLYHPPRQALVPFQPGPDVVGTSYLAALSVLDGDGYLKEDAPA